MQTFKEKGLRDDNPECVKKLVENLRVLCRLWQDVAEGQRLESIRDASEAFLRRYWPETADLLPKTSEARVEACCECAVRRSAPLFFFCCHTPATLCMPCATVRGCKPCPHCKTQDAKIYRFV